jgi:hypothetical protein
VPGRDDGINPGRRGGQLQRWPLLAEFTAYLDRGGVDPTKDLVGFRQHAVWLSRKELEDLIADIRKVIAPGSTTRRAATGPATC